MRKRVGVIGVLLLAVLGAACEEDAVVRVGGPATPGAGAAGQAQAPDAQEEESTAAPLTYGDEDFVEVEIRNRDPFRSFVDAFKLEAPTEVQRRVIMPDATVEQMRLVAIISGVPQPRGMLTDPSGVGHIVKRGDYVGRAEVVQAGGPEGMPVTLNWRIDRIRPNEVVLTREDPTAPNRPPLTRVLTLYDEEEMARAGL